MLRGALIANSDERFRLVCCEHIGQGRMIRTEDAARSIGVSVARMNAILSGRKRAYADEMLSLFHILPHEAVTKVLEGCDLVVDRVAGNDAPCYATTHTRIMEAGLALAEAREDGHVDHREQPRVHNAFRRLFINLVGHLRPSRKVAA